MHDMKKGELLELAQSKGLNPNSNMKKADLIKLIESAESGVEEMPKIEKPKADKNSALQNHPKFDKFKPIGEKSK